MQIEKKSLHTLHIKHPDVWDTLDTTFSDNLRATLELISDETEAALFSMIIYSFMTKRHKSVHDEVNQLIADIHADICLILPEDFHEIAMVGIFYFALKNIQFADDLSLLSTFYEYSLEDEV